MCRNFQWDRLRGALWRKGSAVWIGLGVCLFQAPGAAQAAGFCSSTAAIQLEACKGQVKDELNTARAICQNLGDSKERLACQRDAVATGAEASELCLEQRDARLDLCDALGEDRYDPDFDPADFDRTFSSPNPYFPLSIGDHWSYAGPDGEAIEVEVLNATKRIEGVTCVVVHDLVQQDGDDVEDTDDWFGQRRDGTVDYCGEISQTFEYFAGDRPRERELVGIEGSWKAGRDGDKPGTLFPGAPQAGAVYRQEWSAGNAEDAAIVLSTSYRYGQDAELDEHVPRRLAQLLCSSKRPCIVTGEFTPIEPDGFERKYYARDVGRFLEVDPESGEVVRLVGCNVDSRCGSLPQP
jgi:hypothetical protein